MKIGLSTEQREALRTIVGAARDPEGVSDAELGKMVRIQLPHLFLLAELVRPQFKDRAWGSFG